MKNKSVWKLQSLGCACVLWISACGTVSVQYEKPVASAASQSDSASSVTNIVAAAASGGQTAALPVSRLVVVITPVQSQGGNQNGGGMQGNASPPPNQPAAAPTHSTGKNTGTAPAAPTTAPKPAQLQTQPTLQAAQQAGGNQSPKSSDGAAQTPSVTTTLTSADGTWKYAVNVIQIESAVAFSVKPTNNFFSQNDFGIARLANTRIPTTVSNTFTDQTASRIKDIASIAAAIIPLAAAAAPSHGAPISPVGPQCLTEDLVVDDDATKPGASWNARKTTWVGTGTNCPDITLTADPLAPNLVPVASLVAAMAAKSGGDWSKVWPVPACMSVHVTIKPKDGNGQYLGDASVATGQLTIIDPDYVELLPIPKKGKIAMHPICGADLADSATDPYQSDFDTINAITAAFPAKKTSK